jgi:hypothetical protein
MGLADVLGNASQIAATQASSAVSHFGQAINAIPNNLGGQVSVAAGSALGSVTQNALGGVGNAIKQFAAGNPAAAVNQLLQTPGNVISGIDNSIRNIPYVGPIAASALADIGLTSSSINLDLQNMLGLSDGTTGLSATSSNNGVNEGNSLAGALARSDPLLDFNWYCLMPQINGTPMGSVGLPWYYVIEAHVPFRTYQTRTIFRQGLDKKYISKYSVGDLELTMYMDTQHNAWDYLKAWNAAIIKPFTAQEALTKSGQFLPPALGKQTIYIYLMDNTKLTVHQILLTGCLPVSINPFSLASDSNGMVTAKVTFSVDDVWMDINNTNGFFNSIFQAAGSLFNNSPTSGGNNTAAANPPDQTFPITQDNITVTPLD